MSRAWSRVLQTDNHHVVIVGLEEGTDGAAAAKTDPSRVVPWSGLDAISWIGVFMSRVDASTGQWRHFRDAAFHYLSRFEIGDYLVFDVPKSDGLYVQIIMERNGSLRAEASGPSSQGGTADLTHDQRIELLGLGWDLPTASSDSANYEIYWVADSVRLGNSNVGLSSSDIDDACSVIVKTLRDVFRVDGPQAIEVQGDNMYREDES